MRGWLLDTNVVASLTAQNGAPSVKAWASGLDERRLYLSVLTLAEYDKGIAQLPDDDERRSQYAVARDLIAARFKGRLLPVQHGVDTMADDKDYPKNDGSQPGVMGDGTEEQNLGQPGDPKARITEDEVKDAFGNKDGDAKSA